jgi:hypothetical protein
MKNRIVFTLLFLLLSSCSTQRSNLSTGKIYKIINTTVTPYFEKFDFINFNKIVQDITASNTINPPSVGDNAKELHFTGAQYILKEFDSSKNLIKQTFKTDQSILALEYLSPLFRFQRHYYSNGNIESKVVSSWLGFTIGKQYFFDEGGKLTRVNNTDDGYQFDYNKVLNFCAQNNILIEERTSGPRLTISKRISTTDQTKNWYIESPQFKSLEYDEYVLDGMTGELKLKSKQPFINDGL